MCSTHKECSATNEPVTLEIETIMIKIVLSEVPSTAWCLTQSSLSISL